MVYTLNPKKLTNRVSYGQPVSEWFNQRFVKTLAVTPSDPGRKKRFHSFRSTIINAAKQAGADVRMVEETFGHADSTGTRKQSMSFDGYAEAYAIKTRYDQVIQLVDFGLDLEHLFKSKHVRG